MTVKKVIKLFGIRPTPAAPPRVVNLSFAGVRLSPPSPSAAVAPAAPAAAGPSAILNFGPSSPSGIVLGPTTGPTTAPAPGPPGGGGGGGGGGDMPFSDGRDGGGFTGAAAKAPETPAAASKMTTPVVVGLGVGAAAIVGLIMRAAIK